MPCVCVYVHSPKQEKEQCVARNPETYLLLDMYILQNVSLHFLSSSVSSNADDSQMCKFLSVARARLLTLWCISTCFASQFMVFQACHISQYKTEPLVWNPPAPAKKYQTFSVAFPVRINSNFICSLA